MSGGNTVSLVPFDRSQAPLLAEWLTQPHVARWFPDPVARLEWALDPPPGGANALIGETGDVGRGLGPKALALLIDRLRADPTVPLAGLTPSVDNLFAQRAYEKAGFRKSREYEAPGFGRGVLMVMRLDQ